MRVENTLDRKSYDEQNNLKFEDVSQVSAGYSNERYYLKITSKRRKEGLYEDVVPWVNHMELSFENSNILEKISDFVSQRESSDIDLTFEEIIEEVEGNFQDGKSNSQSISYVRYCVEEFVISFICYNSDDSQIGTATIPISTEFRDGEYTDEDNLKKFGSILKNLLSYSESSGPISNKVTKSSKEYDVFISHASEDKKDFVRPLASELEKSGIEPWYDEHELTLGDNIRQSIDEGLQNARFGVVVLSESFFGKDWTERELDALVAKEDQGDKMIIPIWHEVDHEDVARNIPTLAGKLAVKTDSKTIDEIVAEIKDAVE